MASHGIRHWAHRPFKSAVEFFTAPRKETAFREKGVLTPQEFVLAGDNLVTNCPTWSWESGDPSKRASYLPETKQYLITRNVPCFRRAMALETDHFEEEFFIDGDESSWLITRLKDESPTNGDGVIPSIESSPTRQGQMNEGMPVKVENREGNKGESRNLNEKEEEVDDDDDIPDVSDFVDDDNLVIEDPAALDTTYFIANEPDDNNVLLTRTYDILISYDKFYQTPRIWLYGYNEFKVPLSPQQMFQDFIGDYVNKTITVENHPNLPGRFVSVHPCQHAAVMKKFLDVLISHGVEPKVDQYLFIFLKFIASLVPTIEYDYTTSMELGKLESPRVQ